MSGMPALSAFMTQPPSLGRAVSNSHNKRNRAAKKARRDARAAKAAKLKRSVDNQCEQLARKRAKKGEVVDAAVDPTKDQDEATDIAEDSDNDDGMSVSTGYDTVTEDVEAEESAVDTDAKAVDNAEVEIAMLSGEAGGTADDPKTKDGEAEESANDPEALADSAEVGFKLVMSKQDLKKQKKDNAKKQVKIASKGDKLVPVIIEGIPSSYAGLALHKELQKHAPGVRVKRMQRLERGGVLILPCTAEDGVRLLTLAANFGPEVLGGHTRAHYAGEKRQNEQVTKHKVVAYGIDQDWDITELRESIPAEAGILQLGRLGNRALVVEVESKEAADRLCRFGLQVLWLSLKCKPFKEKAQALQCYKCQGFGHVAAMCKNERKCVHCGQSDNACKGGSDCANSDRKCANCESRDHTAAYKGCPRFKQACSDLHEKKQTYAKVAAETKKATATALHKQRVSGAGKAQAESTAGVTPEVQILDEALSQGAQTHTGPDTEAIKSLTEKLVEFMGKFVFLMLEQKREERSCSNFCGTLADLANSSFDLNIKGENLWKGVRAETQKAASAPTGASNSEVHQQNNGSA